MSELTSAQPDAGVRRWLPEVEAVRAFAYVSIVLGHVIGVLNDVPHDATTMAVFSAVLAVTRPALPAFMMLSALLIALRARSSDKVAWPLSALWRLVVTYVIWSAVYVVMLKTLSGTTPVSVYDVLRDIAGAVATGRGWYHLWYFLIAFQIYLVAPALVLVLRGMKPVSQGIFLVVVTAGNVLLLGQIGQPDAMAVPGGEWLFGVAFDRVIIFWMSYAVLGVIVGLSYERIVAALERWRLPLLTIYVASVIAVATLAWQAAIITDGSFSASAEISRVMQPWIMPFQMLSVVAWLLLARVLVTTRLSSLAATLGRASLGGYLVHPLVLLGLQQAALEYLPETHPALLVVGLFLLTLLISTAISLGLSRVGMSVGTALVGARPERSARSASAEQP